MMTDTIFIRWLGTQEYSAQWHAMQEFTQQRDEHTIDEIWLLEHYPVFTQGQAGRPEHLLHHTSIPLVHTDRGGQITYHGPGQLMIYTLINLQRKKIHLREFVTQLENAVIQFLQTYHLPAYSNAKAPGVYLDEKKICSIGLRIRRGCAYHGLAINIAMDMSPYQHIHPCGFAELKMTQLSEFIVVQNSKWIGQKILKHLLPNLGYTNAEYFLNDFVE